MSAYHLDLQVSSHALVRPAAFHHDSLMPTKVSQLMAKVDEEALVFSEHVRGAMYSRTWSRSREKLEPLGCHREVKDPSIQKGRPLGPARSQE